MAGQSIPESFRKPNQRTGGVIQLHYPSRVYNPDLPEYGQPYAKSVRVYLPYGYDKDNTYNTVYALHGGGGDDYYDWLSESDPNPVWIYENLADAGLVQPSLLVFPNGRSDPNQNKDHLAWNSFYSFGPDLRYDLIPFIESSFPVGKGRQNRAICGLSLGGFQTTQIGMGELYDLFAWFGAFSASFNSPPGMTFSAKKALDVINNSGYDLEYLFMICGMDDKLCIGDFMRDVKDLAALLSGSDKISEGENYSHVEVDGAGHNYGLWQYALYRFLQLIFTD